MVNWANKGIFSGCTWWWWWLHRVRWWWQWWGWWEPWSGRDWPLPPQRWEDLHRAAQRHPRVWSHRRLKHLLPQPQGETGGPGWLQTPRKINTFLWLQAYEFSDGLPDGKGAKPFLHPTMKVTDTIHLLSCSAQKNFKKNTKETYYPFKQTSNLHIHKTFTNCWNI